jgi:hypothetical protein
MKVVELKQRIIEKLESFRDTPKLLPFLVHARYANSLGRIKVGIKSASVSVTETYLGWLPPKKNRPHQIHTQHRVSIIQVLKHLIHRLDLRSMECKMVAPKYGISRGLYIPEIARHTNLCERTVQRCLATLVRSGYIRRVAGDRFIKLSANLFRHLSLNLALDRLRQQLLGIAKKGTTAAPRFGHRNDKAPDTNNATGQSHASHSPYVHTEHQGTINKQGALDALDAIRDKLGRRRRPPPG